MKLHLLNMDYEVIDKQNKDLIIDRSKVRQECEKERFNNQSFQTCSVVQALYCKHCMCSVQALYAYCISYYIYCISVVQAL